MTTITARPLKRILGLGFGIALVFGTMIGVGILRLPGTVAAALGDRTLIMVFWGLGGLYALMGAVSISELAAMIPETGGFRVYARRAFGEGVGFAVGWVDWLVQRGLSRPSGRNCGRISRCTVAAGNRLPAHARHCHSRDFHRRPLGGPADV